jgi:hypothetical protein
MDIIGDVVVTPSTPKQAESVLIEVHAPDGNPIDEATGPQVRIDGVTGPRQYVQFARAGKHSVSVIAVDNSQVQRRTVDIEVAPIAGLLATSTAEAAAAPQLAEVRAAIAELPMLQVGKSVNESYRVAFSVGGFKVFSGGLANVRPVRQKTLEPELNERPSDSAVGTAVARPELGPVVGRELGARVLPPTRTVAAGDRLRLVPEGVKLLADKSDRIRGVLEIRKPLGAVILQPPPVARADIPVYHWDFGDGTTATSHGPRVEHDYEPALDPNREHQSFDVMLRIEQPDGSIQELRRTLSVFNAYAVCKKRGAIVPRVEQQHYASTEGLGFSAALRVDNVENFSLTLTAQRIRIMSEDTDQVDVLSPLVPINPITVPAHGSTEIPVFVPFFQVPKRSMGFTAYFFGNAPDGTAIRVEATFDVRARDRASDAVTFGDIAVGGLTVIKDLLAKTSFGPANPTTAAGTGNLPSVLGELRAVGSVAGSETASRLETDSMNARVLGNSLTHLGRASGASGLAPTTDLLTFARALMVPPTPIEGSECDPDNLPDLSQEQLDEGWVCQSTPETREVLTPARFLNALKGDIILSPGGNGLIGGLLMQVTPPQRYSHSGIMTRNYDQVTHSTASEDRLLDHPNGSVFGQPAPTDGFVPNALKYLWPGVITQSVEQAVYGEDFVDPEGGKTYKIRGFSPTPEGADVAGHWELIPPLVVKPDPLLETPEIRMKLRQIANDALAQTGNSHYRFFCYTDPSLGQRPEGVAPPTAGWAAGTYPSVCSSLIWMTIKRQSSHLESANVTVSPADLEALDVAAGAQVDGATLDGLYLYTAQERLAAAEWLRADLADRIARKLEEDSGILAGAIDLFTDIIDDVANQMLNTFESDWADTAAKDSEAWRQTTDANAISPDNILLWDSPQAVGLYGYAAPMHFRPSRLEEIVVHRWRKVPTKGRLSGRVWFNGSPVGGALVQLYDGKSDFTDANGAYEITGIPFGSYTAKAWKDNVNGMMVSTSVSVSLNQPTQSLDITLQPPADAYRRVQIQARIQTTDDEWWPWDDEHADTSQFQEVFIGPWHTHEEVYFEQRMGGEVRIELRFVVDLNADRSANINVNAKMFEGTTEDTTDLNDEENTTGFRVAKDQSRSGSLRLYNEEFAGGDISNISFTITNLVQP